MSGDRSIEAIFEDGVFKPLDAVRLPEHQRVCLVVTSVDDLPAALLAAAAEIGQSFSFLEDPREDLYSLVRRRLGRLGPSLQSALDTALKAALGLP